MNVRPLKLCICAHSSLTLLHLTFCFSIFLSLADLMCALEEYYKFVQKDEYKNLKLFDYLYGRFECEPTQSIE